MGASDTLNNNGAPIVEKRTSKLIDFYRRSSYENRRKHDMLSLDIDLH